MNCYLDASVLVSLFVIDPLSTRAEAFLADHLEIVIAISDFGAAEFASAVARRVRARDLSEREGRVAFANFDSWAAHSAERQRVESADINAADRVMRQMHHPLRTPDAIHVMIAQRIGASLVTFDRQMAASARALGAAVAEP